MLFSGYDAANPLYCQVIPSYLYWQYRDDDNLQGFVDAQNIMAQSFVTWFCDLNLPIYTDSPIDGALLDWVAEGLYGFPRPTLGQGIISELGELNTYQLNTMMLNDRKLVGSFTADPVDDDLYRRIITWHFYKGDGKVFSIRWLKRRIMRFLTGDNGIDPGVDQTYRISVSFGLCFQVNIIIKRFKSGVIQSAMPNTFMANTLMLDELDLGITTLGPPFALAGRLKEAIEQGALELPFQYSYVVSVE